MLDFSRLIPEDGTDEEALRQADLARQTTRTVAPAVQAQRDATRLAMLRTEQAANAEAGAPDPSTEFEIERAVAGRDLNNRPTWAAPSEKLDFSTLQPEEPTARKGKLDFSKLELIADPAATRGSDLNAPVRGAKKPTADAQPGDEFTPMGDLAIAAPAEPQPRKVGGVTDLIPDSRVSTAPGTGIREDVTGPPRPGPSVEAATRAEIQTGARANPLVSPMVRNAALAGPPSAQQGARGTDFDFETAARLDAAPVGRRMLEGGETALRKQMLGFASMFAESRYGEDSDAAKTLRQMHGESGAKMDAINSAAERGAMGDVQKYSEQIAQSIATNIPTMGLAVIGAPAAGLLSMGALVMGDEYADGRKRGLDAADAMQRGAWMGSFEVLGEMLGLPSFSKLVKASLKPGMTGRDVVSAIAGHIPAEMLGEQYTTAGQFLVDKLKPYGLTPDATLGDYLEQVKDTFIVTLGQTAVMGAGGAVANAATRRWTAEGRAAGAAEAADQARSDALAKWAGSPLSQGAAAPGAATQPAAQSTAPEEPVTVAPKEEDRATKEAEFQQSAVKEAKTRDEAVAEAGRLTEETGEQHRARSIAGVWTVVKTATQAAQPAPEAPATDEAPQGVTGELQTVATAPNAVEAVKRAAELTRETGLRHVARQFQGVWTIMAPVVEAPAAEEVAAEPTAEAPAAEAPKVGDRVEFERGFPEQTVQGTVTGFKTDPVTKDEVPLVDMGSGSPHPAAEYLVSGRVVAPAAAPVQDAGSSSASASESGNRATVTPAPAGVAVSAPTIDTAAHEAATSPTNEKTATKEQILGGNAELGHPKIAGMDLSIENPHGSIREDLKSDPPKWRTQMRDHYGYIKGTVGYDKDHLDVFVKPGTPEDFDGTAFVVNQNKGNGQFDEHKVILGATDEADARATYLRNYDKGFESRIRSITPLPMGEFKAWAFDKTDKGPKGGALEQEAPKAESAPEAPAAGGFDSEAFDRKRNEAIAESRKTRKHLDDIGTPSVETMRGKKIESVHDPKEVGEVLTVDNRGSVYVRWADDYSAQKNLASPMQDDRGRDLGMVTTLGPSDLKDYAVTNPEYRYDPATYKRPGAKKPAMQKPKKGAAPAAANVEEPKKREPSVMERDFDLEELDGFKRGQAVMVGKKRGTITAFAKDVPGEKKGGPTRNRALVAFPADAGESQPYEQFHDLHTLLRADQPTALIVGPDARPLAPKRPPMRKEKKAAEKPAAPAATQPVHVEAGKVEAADPTVIRESIAKGAARTPMNYAETRTKLLAEIDAAIAAAPTMDEKGAREEVKDGKRSIIRANRGAFTKETFDDEIGYVSLDVPGDGPLQGAEPQGAPAGLPEAGRDLARVQGAAEAEAFEVHAARARHAGFHRGNVLGRRVHRRVRAREERGEPAALRRVERAAPDPLHGYARDHAHGRRQGLRGQAPQGQREGRRLGRYRHHHRIFGGAGRECGRGRDSREEQERRGGGERARDDQGERRADPGGTRSRVAQMGRGEHREPCACPRDAPGGRQAGR
jgi:hypothetical protein